MLLFKAQRGVGMIEVLVALLVLAIGVLGFSALQLRAFQATAEATDRTMAMNLARDLADRIRINRLGLSDYVTAINNKTTETGCLGSAVSFKPNCNSAKMAKYDATEVLAKAAQKGQTVIMRSCDGSARNCIYVAWGNTNITANNVSECMTAGVYKPEAQCLVMETF